MEKIKPETLQPGQILDELIAEKIMGLVPCDKWEDFSLGSAGGLCKVRVTRDFPTKLVGSPEINELGVIDMAPCYVLRSPEECCPHGIDACYPRGRAPQYSQNIQAAWGIAEKFRKENKYVAVAIGPGFVRASVQKWDDRYADPRTAWVGLDGNRAMDADSVPLAICRAALKAAQDGWDE